MTLRTALCQVIRSPFPPQQPGDPAVLQHFLDKGMESSGGEPLPVAQAAPELQMEAKSGTSHWRGGGCQGSYNGEVGALYRSCWKQLIDDVMTVRHFC